MAPNAFTDSATVFFPPVAAIDRIEVIRGPMSTLYGADAIGGVVNIITRRPGPEWEASAILDSTFPFDSEFGNSTGFEAYAGGPLATDLLSAQVYGRVIDRAEGRVTFLGQDTSSDAQRTMGQSPVDADIYTAGGKLLLTPDARNEITLGADWTEQTYNNNRGQMGSIRPGAGYAPELKFEREQYYLGYSGSFDVGLLEATLSHNLTRTLGRTIPNAAATPESGRRGTPRRLENDQTVFDARFLTPIGSHLLTLGGQYWEASLTDGIPQATFRNSQWGLFVEDEWRILDNLALTAGLRYDDHDAFGGVVTPRAYLVWNATDQFTMKGGFGQGYKAPFLEQLHDGIIGFGDQGRVALFGNPDLDPERSTNYEISGIFESPAGHFAQATLFYTEVKDKIERPTGALGLTQEFANIGEARIQGAEVVASYRLAPDWTIGGNYTYTDSEVTTSNVRGIRRGDPLFGVPKHMANVRLSWQARPQLSTFLETEYRSSRFRPDSFHEPHLGGAAQGATEVLGDFREFAVVNLGASWRFTDNIALNAVIYNLLDKDFNDYRGYPLRNDPEVIAFSNVYNNIYEPRRLWVSLSMDF